jgi:dUTP pyrophosphatase
MKVSCSGMQLPKRAHLSDAGQDLQAVQSYWLPFGMPRLVRTGFRAAPPPDLGFLDKDPFETQFSVFGTFYKLMDRSGMAKRGIAVLGGVIDSGYRGEWGVVLVNLNLFKPLQRVRMWDKVAQAVHLPYVNSTFEPGSLDSSERGAAGFGSTGA